MTGLELDAIEARAAFTAPGPWTWEYDYEPDDEYPDEGPGGVVGAELVGPDGREVLRPWSGTPVNISAADATFIAAAREDVPALVFRVHELEHQLSELLPLARELAHTRNWHCPYDQGDHTDCSYCGIWYRIEAGEFGEAPS